MFVNVAEKCGAALLGLGICFESPDGRHGREKTNSVACTGSPSCQMEPRKAATVSQRAGGIAEAGGLVVCDRGDVQVQGFKHECGFGVLKTLPEQLRWKKDCELRGCAGKGRHVHPGCDVVCGRAP